MNNIETLERGVEFSRWCPAVEECLREIFFSSILIFDTRVYVNVYMTDSLRVCQTQTGCHIYTYRSVRMHTCARDVCHFRGMKTSRVAKRASTCIHTYVVREHMLTCLEASLGKSKITFLILHDRYVKTKTICEAPDLEE